MLNMYVFVRSLDKTINKIDMLIVKVIVVGFTDQRLVLRILQKFECAAVHSIPKLR